MEKRLGDDKRETFLQPSSRKRSSEKREDGVKRRLISRKSVLPEEKRIYRGDNLTEEDDIKREILFLRRGSTRGKGENPTLGAPCWRRGLSIEKASHGSDRKLRSWGEKGCRPFWKRTFSSIDEKGGLGGNDPESKRASCENLRDRRREGGGGGRFHRRKKAKPDLSARERDVSQGEKSTLQQERKGEDRGRTFGSGEKKVFEEDRKKRKPTRSTDRIRSKAMPGKRSAYRVSKS